MSINSVSFWQQDQNYWQKSQAQGQASSAAASLINVMGQAETNLAKGLASIANGTALKRVNNELTAAVQAVLQPSSGGSTSSSSSGTTGSASSSSASAGSSASTGTSAAPATGIGKAPLTAGTLLSTLGILPNGTIAVSAGINTTTYTSTGTDTVGDLIDALNIDLPTNAQVTASLNSSGRLVITSRDDTDTISIGGSGTDAAVLGFGIGNNTFQPVAPKSTAASSTAASPTAASATSSATQSNSANKYKVATDVLPAKQSFSTGASILSASGVSGSLVDMLT
jgi:hypothetical protein